MLSQQFKKGIQAYRSAPLAEVVQWIKKWVGKFSETDLIKSQIKPTDLAVRVRAPPEAEIFSIVNVVPLHKSFISIRPSS